MQLPTHDGKPVQANAHAPRFCAPDETPEPDTAFPQAYAAPPAYPTPEEVEEYRSATHHVGRVETFEHLREGRIAAAYHRIVRATEAELKITDGHTVFIPTVNRAFALVQRRFARRGWM